MFGGVRGSFISKLARYQRHKREETALQSIDIDRNFKHISTIEYSPIQQSSECQYSKDLIRFLTN